MELPIFFGDMMMAGRRGLLSLVGGLFGSDEPRGLTAPVKRREPTKEEVEEHARALRASIHRRISADRAEVREARRRRAVPPRRVGTAEISTYRPDLSERAGRFVGRLMEGDNRHGARAGRRIENFLREFTPLGALDTALDYQEREQLAEAEGRVLDAARNRLGRHFTMSGVVPPFKLPGKAGKLATDEASRLARAEQMGFDPRSFWHGDRDGIWHDVYKPAATYFSTSKEGASPLPADHPRVNSG